MTNDRRLVKYMKRLSAAWDAGDKATFLDVLREIREDSLLTGLERRAVACTVAQQQAATFIGVLSQGGPIVIPEGAGWAGSRS